LEGWGDESAPEAEEVVEQEGRWNGCDEGEDEAAGSVGGISEEFGEGGDLGVGADPGGDPDDGGGPDVDLTDEYEECEDDTCGEGVFC